MQCNINNVKRICGYNQAARYFEETKKPRSAKWSDDERPLYNTRSHHYRIIKGNDNGVPFYDLVLYSTSMIRYYEPDASNNHRVLVRGHYSAASGNFLWHHGFARGKTLECVDGYGNVRAGKLLLNHATHDAEKYGVPYNWSADLMFVGNPIDAYRIDLTRSRHIPGYKAASSDDDKARRKALRNTVDHWIELLGYRLDEYLNTEITTNKWQKQRSGEAFTSALELLTWKECDVIRNAIDCAMAEDKTNMESESFVNAMTQLGHAVATHLQGVRENQREVRRGYDEKGVWRTLFEGELKPVTRADFRKSMESHLISMLNLRVGSARVDMGQFPESIPRKWWC